MKCGKRSAQSRAPGFSQRRARPCWEHCTNASVHPFLTTASRRSCCHPPFKGRQRRHREAEPFLLSVLSTRAKERTWDKGPSSASLPAPFSAGPIEATHLAVVPAQLLLAPETHVHPVARNVQVLRAEAGAPKEAPRGSGRRHGEEARAAPPASLGALPGTPPRGCDTSGRGASLNFQAQKRTKTPPQIKQSAMQKDEPGREWGWWGGGCSFRLTMSPSTRRGLLAPLYR